MFTQAWLWVRVCVFERVSVLLIGTDVSHGLNATDGQSSRLLLFFCLLGMSLDMQGLVQAACVCVCARLRLLWLLLTSCYQQLLYHQTPGLHGCVCVLMTQWMLVSFKSFSACMCVWGRALRWLETKTQSIVLWFVGVCLGGLSHDDNAGYGGRWGPTVDNSTGTQQSLYDLTIREKCLLHTR